MNQRVVVFQTAKVVILLPQPNPSVFLVQLGPDKIDFMVASRRRLAKDDKAQIPRFPID
jgi:hypothetical protein